MRSENRKNPSTSQFIKITVVALLAFFAGLTFRQSVGIIAMTPVFLVFCGIGAFVNAKTSVKLVCFGVTVFWLNTVENKNMKTVLIFTALCLLACAIFEIGARFIKKQSKLGTPIFCTGAITCAALSFLLVGNPFTALTARDTINGYADGIYPKNEDEFFGRFEFSNIKYDFETETYSIEAKSTKFPTEGAPISYTNGNVRDGFIGIAKQKASEPYVLEFTDILRKSFPSDGFSVEFERFTFLPNENLFSAGGDKLYGNVDFEITLNGIQSVPEFFERAERYYEVISESGINYSSVTFKTGTSARNGIWFSRSVTLDPNYSPEFAEFKFRLVPTGTSEFFNEYFSSFTTLD